MNYKVWQLSRKEFNEYMKTEYLKITRLLHVMLTILMTVTIFSCGKHGKKDLLTADESFHRAMEKFNRGKYLDASDELTLITLNYSGSSIIDSAQYYLGEAHFLMKEYIIAASEYQRLVNQFPSSSLVDDAKYKTGLCYYRLSPKYSLDQEYTHKCVDEFQEFTEFFPESELTPEVLDKIHLARTKLARKTYQGGRLYYKMHDYNAAIIYFNDVLDNYYDTIYAPKAMLGKGESYLSMKMNKEAEEVFRKLIEKHPQTPEAEHAKLKMNPEGEVIER